MLGACASPPKNERETGNGGTLVRYSSSQVAVDLTDAEQQSLRAMRDHAYANVTRDRTMDAVAKVLGDLGFAPVSVDRDSGLVEAEHNATLVPKWRQLLRGALKSYTSIFPAKADHERVAAIVTVRAGDDGGATIVRTRFDGTVWDSNGDSRTKTLLQPELYDDFFSKVSKALSPAADKDGAPK
ncbi:hypothetical protein D7S89_12800 [Trinickia fusca]|uniref:Uncharacterized protein n=2 Tax=Trinickia fusca TaxID=2419777 RepID=A0A494XD88_9BURK|nr:hypothetical protein D7S89_12800 [Trinickia fusca]